MEYLQYRSPDGDLLFSLTLSFKPYYKWNTFNTTSCGDFGARYSGFKPYYKWNTFNTDVKYDNSFN